MKKIHQFLLSTKKMHTEENWSFFLPHGVCRRYSYISLTTVFLAAMNPFHGPANWPCRTCMVSVHWAQWSVDGHCPAADNAIYIDGHRRPYCVPVDRADQVHAGVIVKRWTVQIRGGVWTQGHRHEQLKKSPLPIRPPPACSLSMPSLTRQHYAACDGICSPVVDS